MKIIMSAALIGLIALSCKKEHRTETITTADSIIADTMITDTATHIFPESAPLPSDTIRIDSAYSKSHQDIIGKTRTNRK